MLKFCGARVLAHVVHLQACPQRTRLFAEMNSSHVSASKPQRSAYQSRDCSHESRTTRCMFTTVRGTTRTYLDANESNI
eukprot:5147144-Pleurochrysis_carterae.AAC.1